MLIGNAQKLSVLFQNTAECSQAPASTFFLAANKACQGGQNRTENDEE